jgi:two-component system, NtrC family, sensor kinase
MDIPILHRLSVRVLAGAILLLLLLFGLYSYFTVGFYKTQMMNQIVLSADRMSDVIKQSTRYSMLLNRKDDVYQIISTIGKEPGVEGIRIYNKRGEIMFSIDKSEENTIVDMHTEACYACHSQEKPLESLPTTNRTRIYEASSGHRVLGVINPIRNEPSCSNGDCHAHPGDRTVLGVLDVRMSLKGLDDTIAGTQMTMLSYGAGVIIVIAVVVALFLSVTVLKPVRGLMKGAQEITSGNLDYRIAIRTKDELGTLAGAFNTMTRSVKEEKAENLRWAGTLEQRVREKTEELNAIHKQIVHIEKMVSLGKLAATVAHELNNPLEAILTYAKLIGRRIKRDETILQANRQTVEDIGLIAQEADRCGTIVKNLLLFSKKQTGDFSVVPVRQIVENAAQLVRHHCDISNVKLEMRYADPEITLLCDENQIKQALIALFVNAVEAMPGGGTITVEAGRPQNGDGVNISVTDNGAGIAESDLPFIFEPFFTTKKEVRGVGLGLSVAYGIVERHGGKITVVSSVGKGTTFMLNFPPVSKSQTIQEQPKKHEAV